tara:strand:+ start:366 stop:653 length:288 start_codon:yes stop_codon:yes gene_type:complete
MTPRKEITSRLIALTCDSLLKHIVGRPVIVSFAHLGQDKDYTIAIQKSLYEFDPDMESGQEGPMYITLNRRLLQSTEELLRVLDEIVEAHRRASE